MNAVEPVNLVCGDRATFAIESLLAQSFAEPAQFALGNFTLHVAGRRYGCVDDDAALLACAFDAVGGRVARAGVHRVSDGIGHWPAEQLAYAWLAAQRRRELEWRSHMDIEDFAAAIDASGAAWAPDGDDAFDDGSTVLQFDLGGEVRIVAFANPEDIAQLRESVRETRLPAPAFYALLDRWRLKAYAVRFAQCWPVLRAELVEHLADNSGDVLPYVLLSWSVKRLAALYPQRPAELVVRAALAPIFAQLERDFVVYDDKLKNLIALAIVEELPCGDEPGGWFRQLLGPALTAEFATLHDGHPACTQRAR